MTSRNKILVNFKTFLNSFADYDDPVFTNIERLIRTIKRFKVDVGKPFHYKPEELKAILVSAASKDCTQLIITRESKKGGKHFTGEFELKYSPILPQVLVALFIGMRKDDILNLKWENINLANKTISYTARKNNSPCTIPLEDADRTISPTFAKILAVWEKLRNDDEFVIPHPKSNAPVEWKKKLIKLGKDSGVAEIGYQNFRKTFESYAVSFGIEPAITAMWVAHTTATAAKYYLRYAIGALSGNSIEEAMGLKSIMMKIYNGYLGKGEYKNLKLTKWSP